MLSNKQRKQIVQLSQKKYREQERLFVAEGDKIVLSLIRAGFQYQHLFSTKPYTDIDAVLIDSSLMQKISHFKNASSILGVFHYPQARIPSSHGTVIAVDSIRDPGNLGTIIRICDWFGLNQLICSETTVDCFNPKVIQATMGSIARVSCVYVNLSTFLLKSDKKVYGAALGGSSLYEASLDSNSIMIFGNESHGISDDIVPFINQKLSIPRFREHSEPESLNVATATAIFISEMFRKSS